MSRPEKYVRKLGSIAALRVVSVECVRAGTKRVHSIERYEYANMHIRRGNVSFEAYQ